MIRFQILLAVLVFPMAIMAQNAPVAPKATHRVIMEITSPDTLAWKGAINNILHLKEVWGTSVDIEIVAHGPGINMLAKEKTTQMLMITELSKQGVQFMACMNSMKARNLKKEDLVLEAVPVPSGVVEVVTQEEKGRSYLKSGL